MIFEKINELSIFSESVLLLVFSEVLFSTEMTCSATLIFFAREESILFICHPFDNGCN